MYIMKNLFVFILLIGLSCTIQAQTKAIKTFYKEHKKHQDVDKLSVPGWIVRLGLSLSGQKADMDKVEKKLIKSVKQVRILSTENPSVVSAAKVNALIADMQAEGFDEFISVKDKGDDVAIFLRDDGKKLKNLVILATEAEEFALISMKTKLKMEVFEEIADEIRKEMKESLKKL